MARTAQIPCPHPGCPSAIPCPTHGSRSPSKLARNERDAPIYDYRWKKVRDAYIATVPWCEPCKSQGRDAPARHVDHKIPVRERPDLRLVWENLQAICHDCHAEKGRRDQR